MVRDICKDNFLLSLKAEPASPADDAIADDLLETLIAHKDDCVGMAANMIGLPKRIIAFLDGDTYSVMRNPEIIRAEGAYVTEEGCLSHEGTRSVKRFRTIKVRWQNAKFQTRLKTFSGFTAQIIQHEVDHCEGILI